MSALGVLEGLVALAAFAAGVKFFVLPWVKPLYARYVAWAQAKALGK